MLAKEKEMFEQKKLEKAILEIAKKYPIKRVTLFGSRAAGTNRENSDIDLIMEFSASITLFTLSAIKLQLEEWLQLSVDIVHGPLRDTDMLEIEHEVEIYAA